MEGAGEPGGQQERPGIPWTRGQRPSRQGAAWPVRGWDLAGMADS